jgi:High potential iron-sulfur protein
VEDLPRRIILRRALQITMAIAVAPHVIRTARAAESCVDPAAESLRNSLHYASATANASQPCNACGFFTRDDGKPACGNCMIMSGPVDQNGHCDSWAARNS